MGYAWVDAVIKNPFSGRSISVKALVDTGATLTVIPRRIADELALPVIGKSLVQIAKGVTELEACFGVVGIMGEETPARILVSDELDTVIIGITVLEQLGLEVDPTTGKLKKTKLLLLQHTKFLV
jgi:clan AA aspartic protease